MLSIYMGLPQQMKLKETQKINTNISQLVGAKKTEFNYE